MIGKTNTGGSGGSLEIENGTLTTATAFSDIKKMNFVSNVGLKTSDNASPNTSYDGDRDSCKVGDYYVVLCTNNSGTLYPYCETYKIDNGELKFIKRLQLSTTSYSLLYSSVIESIDNSHAFCFYNNKYCIIEISNTGEISVVVSETTLDSSCPSDSSRAICKLSTEGEIALSQITSDGYIKLYKYRMTNNTVTKLGELKTTVNVTNPNSSGMDIYERYLLLPMRNNKVYALYIDGTQFQKYIGQVVDFSGNTPNLVTGALTWTNNTGKYSSLGRIFTVVDTSEIGLDYDYVVMIDGFYNYSTGNYNGVYYQTQFVSNGDLTQNTRISIANSTTWLSNNTTASSDRIIYMSSQVKNTIVAMTKNDSNITLATLNYDLGTKVIEIDKLDLLPLIKNVSSNIVLNAKLLPDGTSCWVFPVGITLCAYLHLVMSSDNKIGVSATDAKAGEEITYYS